MSALTAKQRELLTFIREWQVRTGESPSFDEMRNALDLKSKSGVHRLISALEERGYIRRLPNRARCIEVLPDPHLPSAALIAAVPTSDLAREARRRGLALGHYHRETIRIGSDTKERRIFVEVRA